MKRKAIIVDIDGTVSDNTHRQHFISYDPKDWDSFFGDASKDTPYVEAVECVNAFAASGHDVIFVTGRAEKCRNDTTDWLIERAGLRVRALNFSLFMRQDGDFRHDDAVKREVYERHIYPQWDVRLVLEDRARVVKMWRELGLTCWQVAEGNF